MSAAVRPGKLREPTKIDLSPLEVRAPLLPSFRLVRITSSVARARAALQTKSTSALVTPPTGVSNVTPNSARSEEGDDSLSDLRSFSVDSNSSDDKPKQENKRVLRERKSLVQTSGGAAAAAKKRPAGK
jgi:hypothetical protein